MTIKRRISRAKTDTEIHVKIHAVFHDPQNLKFHDPNSKFHDPREPLFHSTSDSTSVFVTEKSAADQASHEPSDRLGQSKCRATHGREPLVARMLTPPL